MFDCGWGGNIRAASLEKGIINLMNDRQKIIEHLKKQLDARTDIHAFWIEGSVAQGYYDEYSDIDLWLSVDDDKIFTIYDDIEQILSQIAPIDFRYLIKNTGELGHIAYHLEGMSDFLTIDINTQGIGRDVKLVEGVDDAKVIFDKQKVVDFRVYPPRNNNLDDARKRLGDYYKLISLSVIKSIKRDKPLETIYYYHLILQYVTKFLRLKYGWHEKTDYDLKHIYRDIPENEVKNLERFYGIRASEVEGVLPELEKWIRSL